MLTTCPECQTTFRVTQAQLDKRRGMVRCGRCSAVFNAYDTLLPELQTPDVGEIAGTLAPSTPSPSNTPLTVASDGQAEDRPPPGPASGAGDAGRDPTSSTPAEAATPHAPSPEPSPEAILLAELPKPAARPAVSNLLWGMVSTALAIVFALQLVYFLRAEIASLWPQARSPLEQACAWLGCRLPLPQDPKAVRIEASSLETEAETPARAQLRLTLSNRSTQTVAWPHLVLTLTDARDAPIAQRPFAPSEYLAGQVDSTRGMPPGLEHEVTLALELKGLTAQGYKLDKRYP